VPFCSGRLDDQCQGLWQPGGKEKVTEQDDPKDKGVRILLEALTTISYQKGGDGRAAAIAEYALDQYGRAIQEAGAADRQYGAPGEIVERGAELQSISGHLPEQRNQHARRRSDRLYGMGEALVGPAERRRNADRRVNPDRRRDPWMTAEQ
jgi:hypothetical protein